MPHMHSVAQLREARRRIVAERDRAQALVDAQPIRMARWKMAEYVAGLNESLKIIDDAIPPEPPVKHRVAHVLDAALHIDRGGASPLPLFGRVSFIGGGLAHVRWPHLTGEMVLPLRDLIPVQLSGSSVTMSAPGGMDDFPITLADDEDA